MDSIPQKRCTKCKQQFPSTTEFFSRDKQKKCGLRSECKNCNHQTQLNTRLNNAELIKVRRYKRYHSDLDMDYEGERARQKAERQERRDYLNKYLNTYYHEQKTKSPEKINARKAVNQAMKTGVLIPITQQVCNRCGGRAQHYHHWSYEPEHFLDVIPLCAACHKKVHEELAL